MHRPTKAQIIAALARFKVDPKSSKQLLDVVCDYIGFGFTEVTAILAKSPASITVDEIGNTISWLRMHWIELTISQQLSFRSDLSALRTGVLVSARVKAYVNQALLRFPSVGDDDDTVTHRLDVVLKMRVEEIDVDEFQHLMERAKVIYKL